jgi:hypothetical protein
MEEAMEGSHEARPMAVSRKRLEAVVEEEDNSKKELLEALERRQPLPKLRMGVKEEIVIRR